MIIYTWKCHKDTPCGTILNKNNAIFFLLQKQRTGGQSRSYLGEVVPVGVERR
jgi:hypothetical protein